jgi:hypothetical protein
MSLLNAWVLPSEILVAVDTDGVRIDGSRFASSKLLPIPHLQNAILALRGQAAFLQFLFVRCASAGFDTFDELNAALPEILVDMVESMPAELIVAAPHVHTGNVLIAAGWSDERQAMLGRQFVQREAGQEFVAQDFTTLLTPWPPELQDLPRTPQAADMIARAQVRWMRETFPNAIVGGKLVLCRLTRPGIELVCRPLDVEVMA